MPEKTAGPTVGDDDQRQLRAGDRAVLGRGEQVRAELERRRVWAAALLQATSLPFIVAATQIGQSLGVIDAATSAGFIAAGLVTVLVFPISALSLLRGGRRRTEPSPRPAGVSP